MSVQPEKKEAGPSTDPTPPQTLHDNADHDRTATEVQEVKPAPEQDKKKREYKEFAHDENKATRMSFSFTRLFFSPLLSSYTMLMSFITFQQMQKSIWPRFVKIDFPVCGLHTAPPVRGLPKGRCHTFYAVHGASDAKRENLTSFTSSVGTISRLAPRISSGSLARRHRLGTSPILPCAVRAKPMEVDMPYGASPLHGPSDFLASACVPSSFKRRTFRLHDVTGERSP